jgi:hypothetical protein
MLVRGSAFPPKTIRTALLPGTNGGGANPPVLRYVHTSARTGERGIPHYCNMTWALKTFTVCQNKP